MADYHAVMTRLSLASLFFLLCSMLSALSVAQEEARDSLIGSWEGPLVLGRENMSMAFTFSEENGEYKAALISGGLGIYGMPADSVTIADRRIEIRIARLDLEFTGSIRFDESGEKILRIDGDWFQYSEMVPVVLLPVDSPSF